MRQTFWIQCVLAVGAVLLFPTEAAACCTAANCGYVVSGSSQCQTSNLCQLLGTNPCPTCNLFACNCNPGCGLYSDAGIGQPCPPYVCPNSEAARAAARTRFNEVDKDRNGKINRREARAWLDKTKGKKWIESVPNRGKATASQLFKREFNRADSDRNGVITPGEFDESLKVSGS